MREWDVVFHGDLAAARIYHPSGNGEGVCGDGAGAGEVVADEGVEEFLDGGGVTGGEK